MIVGLPTKWRLEAENATGQSFDVTLLWRGQKLVSGALDYAAAWVDVWDSQESDPDASPVTDVLTSSTHDNSDNKYLGAEVWWKIKGPNETLDADGLFTIRLQTGDDGGSPEFQQAGDGVIVATSYVKTTTALSEISGHFSI